jgi:uncharacterized membrane protein YedE/YeeE
MEVTARLQSSATGVRQGAAYMNPYLAGVGIGLVLLATFVIMGRGLGASGAFSAFLVWLMSFVSPDYVTSNAVHAGYWNEGKPLVAFLVFLTIGSFTGAAISGWLAGRSAWVVERGPRISTGARLALAFAGGAIMAVGAKLASGCTSGQALTGGALLNVGSWTFMIAVFIGGYALAPLLKRQWL